MILQRLRWKCNCSCVVIRLRNKSSKFYISSILNKMYKFMLKIIWLCFFVDTVYMQCIRVFIEDFVKTVTSFGPLKVFQVCTRICLLEAVRSWNPNNMLRKITLNFWQIVAALDLQIVVTKICNICSLMAAQQLALAVDNNDDGNDDVHIADNDSTDISQIAIIHSNQRQKRRRISYAYCWR